MSGYELPEVEGAAAEVAGQTAVALAKGLLLLLLAVAILGGCGLALIVALVTR